MSHCLRWGAVDLHAVDDQANEHKEVVALKVLYVPDDPGGGVGEALGHLELVEVDKLAPRSDALLLSAQPLLGQGGARRKQSRLPKVATL